MIKERCELRSFRAIRVEDEVERAGRMGCCCRVARMATRRRARLEW